MKNVYIYLFIYFEHAYFDSLIGNWKKHNVEKTHDTPGAADG